MPAPRLASVVAERVVERGSAQVIDIPGEHLEQTRRQIRRDLRSRGFKSTTFVMDNVLHVISDDAWNAIDSAVKDIRLEQTFARFTNPDAKIDPAPTTELRVVWRTWVTRYPPTSKVEQLRA